MSKYPIKMIGIGDELTDEEWEEFERGLPGRLPAAYRDFLIEFNGGHPEPNVVKVPVHEETDVQVFLGVQREFASSCIDLTRETLEVRLDPSHLPVARDSGGNVFCLSLSEEDCGAVYYYDLEAVFCDFERERAPSYRIANDFLSFLKMLHEFEEEPDDL